MARSSYINNADLLQHFVDWREARKTNPSATLPEPIAEAALKIARNLARRGNFAGYSWTDDMVAEAMLCIVKYSKNFDPEKSGNPFAYLTQLCSNAFVRYIQTQKKQAATKAAVILNGQRSFDVQPGDKGRYTNSYTEFRADALDQEASEGVLEQYRQWHANKRETAKRSVERRKDAHQDGRKTSWTEERKAKMRETLRRKREGLATAAA